LAERSCRLISPALVKIPGRPLFHLLPARDLQIDFNEIVTMTWHRHLPTTLALLPALCALTILALGCSPQTHSLPEVGTADDYLSRQDNAPMYDYRPSELCLA
jgi:hypothetical protein